MTTREFKLPDPGEGLLEAEIVEWKVAVGDPVKVNDIVVEVETAKSLVELPIPWAGTVTGIHVAVGDEVEVGTVIITIDDGAEGAAPADSTPAAESPAPDTAADGADEEPVKTLVGYGPKASGTTRRARRTPAAPTATAAPAAPAAIATPPAPTPVGGADAEAGEAPRPSAAETRALAKPPVRKLAKDLGIDLGAVPPTGERGIVTRADVESYAAGRANPSAASVVAPPTEACDMPPQEAQLQTARAGYGGARRTSGWAAGDDREVRIPIKGVRKVTAQAMVGSAFTAPHVTEWVQVDVTATMELVARLKADREFKDVKVTPLTILAKAICLAVRRNPGVNATWDEAAQEIVEKHYVNLGIAAATPRGLIVPNVKDADTMTLLELAGAINQLTATAREGRSTPLDQAGGTLTITNVGVFGVDGGTPILNPGEAAILAFGQVRRMPWVVGSGADERIEPRSVTTLALSFDHRLVDGELGSKFLADVAAILADPTRALIWG
ncbi:dihydrolipoamide acetyltransferase family protein [Phycicoccus elongatus]|uniref:dihydrolipoamide acetyltransferase family protein n=1 Tax=Phycicoccus elongatus TaxID=101689 RepID=UPI00378403B7